MLPCDRTSFNKNVAAFYQRHPTPNVPEFSNNVNAFERWIINLEFSQDVIWGIESESIRMSLARLSVQIILRIQGK
jgi:hypothetical protein